MEELVRAILSERAEKLGRQYLRSVRPVGIEYSEGHAELIGSAVLLKIGPKRFALSAAHVADWDKKGVLMLGGSEAFWAMPPLRTSRSGGNRERDAVDLAFAELDATTADGLGDVDFLTLDDLDLNGHVATLPFYTAVGYPVVEQNLDRGRNHFAPVATVFSNTALEEKSYRRLDAGIFTPVANFAMKYDPRRVVYKGQVRALKDQNGLSGGGIWRFESLVDPAAKDRLVAITTYAQTFGTKALVGTRVNLFLAAIAHTYPDLAESLPTSNTLLVRVSEAPEA